MQNITHLEKVFLKNIISNPEYLEHAKDGFFENKFLSKLYKIINIWWDKYQSVPTKQQVLEIIKMKNLQEQISEEQIDAVWAVDLSSYDDPWLKEYTEFFIEWKNLESSGLDFVSFLKTTEVTPDNIKSVVDKAKNIIVDRNNIDFSFKEGSDFFDPASHIQKTYNTFSTGYPFIDQVTGGGFRLKTLTVLAGAAKVGKSLWLGNIAGQAVRNGNNVAIITLEMDETMYTSRIGSNLLNVPIKGYKEKSRDSVFMKEQINSFRISNLREPGKLHTREFPTSTASTIDVENYLKKFEEKNNMKFKVVIIDYINIMRNHRNPNSENTYMKIKQIAEDLRGIASANNWAIITATQIKQGDFDSTSMNMNSIAESSGLVATVDLMLGIIQDPLMYTNSEYILKLLANRLDGYKNSSKKFLVDYGYMRIREDEHSDIIDHGL